MSKDTKTEGMARLYRQGKKMREIGIIYGITKQAVQRRLAATGIRSNFNAQSVDKNVLARLFSIDFISIAKIAEQLKISEATVRKALRLYKIPDRQEMKLGGPYVDLLRKLTVGESVEMTVETKHPHITLYRSARCIGIRTSSTKIGDEKYMVTRVE